MTTKKEHEDTLAAQHLLSFIGRSAQFLAASLDEETPAQPTTNEVK